MITRHAYAARGDVFSLIIPFKDSYRDITLVQRYVLVSVLTRRSDDAVQHTVYGTEHTAQACAILLLTDGQAVFMNLIC